MRKTKIVGLICAIIIFLCVGYSLVVNSQYYLNWKIQRTKDSMIELIIQEKYGIQEIAPLICKEAQQNGVLLSYDKYQCNLSEKLKQQLVGFLDQCEVPFNEVYVGGLTRNVYPEGACVFRCTISYRRGVYAWVDLVYIPQLNEQEQQWYKAMGHGSEQITPDWYVSIFYGF